MPDDKFILSEFQKAIRLNAGTQVIDLDDKFKYKFDFQVQRLEDVLKNTKRSIPPNKWSYHRIALFTRGSADFITGIHKFHAHKNTLIVIPERVITGSKDWSLDIEGYVVLFNTDFFLQNNFPHKYITDKRILYSSVRPHIQVTEKQAEEIKVIFETMIAEKLGTNEHKDELIALKIIELLIVSERLFSEELQLEKNLPVMDVVKRFTDLIETHFLHQRSVAFYATQLNMHPNHLNSLIKKHTGLTAKESIQNRLLMETKYLLLSTSLTIKEISSQMGFSDPNYFTVFFKRHENTSPVNYRSSFV